MFTDLSLSVGTNPNPEAQGCIVPIKLKYTGGIQRNTLITGDGYFVLKQLSYLSWNGVIILPYLNKQMRKMAVSTIFH